MVYIVLRNSWCSVISLHKCNVNTTNRLISLLQFMLKDFVQSCISSRTCRNLKLTHCIKSTYRHARRVYDITLNASIPQQKCFGRAFNGHAMTVMRGGPMNDVDDGP